MSEYVVEWHQSPGGWVVWTAPGGRVMVQRVEPGNLTPDEARDLATALLAAARASEAQSSDPAVEAAQRAWAAMAQDMPWTDGGECEELVTAAREALAPIRELHQPHDGPWGRDCGTCYASSGVEWPCPTARLIYTDDELENQ